MLFCLVGLAVGILIHLVSPYFLNLYRQLEASGSLEGTNRYWGAIVLLGSCGALSRICYLLAKKQKRNDPSLWARNGFYLGVFALAWLLLTKPEVESPNHPLESDGSHGGESR